MHITDEQAHVQWFEHSSKTVMGEISDPQELFLNNLCDNIDLDTIVGKATVQKLNFTSNLPLDLPHDHFYYK